MIKLTNTEMEVARLIQKDIELIKCPFENIAWELSMTQFQLIQVIKKFSSKGFIRKFGAILRHQKIGYKKNALIVWSVPSERTDKIGEVFSSFPFVSHCYERKPPFKNKYNLFTMIHSQNNDIMSLSGTMSASIGINDFLILQSMQEYKKTSPEYF